MPADPGSDLGSDSEWVPANEAENEDEHAPPPDRAPVAVPIFAPLGTGAAAGTSAASVGGIFRSRQGSAAPPAMPASLSSSALQTRTSEKLSLSTGDDAALSGGGALVRTGTGTATGNNGGGSEGSWSENGGPDSGAGNLSENLLFSMVLDMSVSTTSEEESAIVARTQIADVGNRSILDCVVELFKGAICQKRKAFSRVGERWIWLSHELNALNWKSKRAEMGRLMLGSVKKLKVAGNELAIETMDAKKTFLAFNTPEEANIWLVGLACLVPKKSSVSGSDQLLQMRASYDPLKDSFNGKALQYSRILNEYLLLSTIGICSFGEVRLAVSKKDKQFYAIKFMARPNRGQVGGKGTAPDPLHCAVLLRLKHPNVIRQRDVLFDAETDTQVHVIQYMPRGMVMDSSRLDGAKPLSEEGVRELMRDVVLGLDYLHRNRIVHLDIKPSNFLRGGDGNVRLSDFSEARMYGLDPRTARGARGAVTPGSPAFAAPELCPHDKAPPAPDELYPADIWSLGTSLYYMVFGRAPFSGNSMSDIYKAICTETLSFPNNPKPSKKLKELLTKMLTRDPKARATLDEVKNHGWFAEKIEQKREYELIDYSNLPTEGVVRQAKWTTKSAK